MPPIIAEHFPSKTNDTTCWCEKVEDTQHNFICKYWTDGSKTSIIEIDIQRKFAKISKSMQTS